MPVDKIRYFPPLGCGITQKGGGEYFEDYPTFVYKADVGGFHQKNPCTLQHGLKLLLWHSDWHVLLFSFANHYYWLLFS